MDTKYNGQIAFLEGRENTVLIRNIQWQLRLILISLLHYIMSPNTKVFAKKFNVIYCNGIISKWNGNWIKRIGKCVCRLRCCLNMGNNKYLVMQQTVYIFFIISLAALSSMLLSVKREETVYVRFRVSGNKRKWREMKAHCSFLRQREWLSLDLKKS